MLQPHQADNWQRAHQDHAVLTRVEAVSWRSLSAIRCSALLYVREQMPQTVIDTGPDGDTTLRVLEPTFDAAQADLSVNFFACGDGTAARHLPHRTRHRCATGWSVSFEAFADRPDQPLLSRVEINEVSAQADGAFGPVNAGAGTAGYACLTTHFPSLFR